MMKGDGGRGMPDIPGMGGAGPAGALGGAGRPQADGGARAMLAEGGDGPLAGLLGAARPDPRRPRWRAGALTSGRVRREPQGAPGRARRRRRAGG